MENRSANVRTIAAAVINFIFPVLTAIIHFQLILFGRLTENSAKELCAVAVFVSFFAYFSLFKQGTKYDLQAKEKYLNTESVGVLTALKLSVTRPYLWIVSGVAAIQFFVFKISAFIATFTNGNASVIARLKISAVCLPIFILLGVLATVSAAKDWEKDGKSNKNYSTAAYCEQIAIAAGAYILGGGVLMFIFPYFSGIFGIVTGLENAFNSNTIIAMITVAAIVIIVPPVLRTLRGLIKRRSFLKQLNKVCAEKGYTLSDIKVPYKSLFQLYAGESFTIQTDKKTYSCKLICGMKKRIPMVMYEDGTGEYIHTVNIGKKGAQIEIFRYVKKFNFGYESENDKIIIVIPVPKFMQMNKAGKVFDMDNGEVIGEYRMFAGTGFINALDRECIDGAKNKNLYKYI